MGGLKYCLIRSTFRNVQYTSSRQKITCEDDAHLYTFRLYCRHYERTFANAEEELLYFLERVAKPGWRWPAKPRPPEHHKNKTGHERHNNGNCILIKKERKRIIDSVIFHH